MTSSLLDVAPVVPGRGPGATRRRPCRWPARWPPGGLPIIELTLRTPAALEAIRRIAAEVPEIAGRRGHVLDRPAGRPGRGGGCAVPRVSPGSTPALLGAMDDTGLPYLPGTSTVSEMLAVAEHGHTAMKFFPAEAAGGAPYLAVAGQPAAGRCGSARPAASPRPRAGRYLRLPNVGCVGGSWLTPADALAAGDWARITALPPRWRRSPVSMIAASGTTRSAVSCLVCHSRRSSLVR